MPKHEVDVTLPRRELGRADAIFHIKADDATLGELRVSRGAVVWFPTNHSYGCKLGWTKFGQLMEESGTRQEKR